MAIFKTEERRNQAFTGQPVYIVPEKKPGRKTCKTISKHLEGNKKNRHGYGTNQQTTNQNKTHQRITGFVDERIHSYLDSL